MRCLSHCLVRFLLVAVGVLVATALGRASDSPAADYAEDETVLGDARIATDGPALLDFIRQRIRPVPDAERIGALIDRLGDVSFKKREQATDELKAIGSAALPALRQGLTAQDAEIRHRAGEIIEFVQSGAMSDRLSAAVRLLQQRRPAGTVRVLLDYLPFVDDTAVEEEVLEILTVLGVRAGKVDPAVVAALASASPAQRGAAAMLVGWAGTVEERQAVKELLHDPDAVVRFRAAQSLLSGGDKAAVPTLIALLQGASPDLSERAEDLLRLVAGASAPEMSRQAPADVWRDWFRSNLERLDLAGSDISLPLVGMNMRARHVALRWVRSLVGLDHDALTKSSDVPFAIADQNFRLFHTRAELDRLIQESGWQNADMSQARFVARDVVSVEQYMTSTVEAGKGLSELLPFLFPGKLFL